MDLKPSFKLVGSPCGQHGQYTFYKALRLLPKDRIVAIGDFFFIRIWQDSELVSIGELQLLWTDRVSDQTLVSLRLYFLPENTPDGRNQHGEDEVLAISDKVVVRAEDLLSWMCDGAGWRYGLRAVWRGGCTYTAPHGPGAGTAPLHHARLDFSDIEREKSAIEIDEESPGVVVFSYPRYCRYRALMARLEGVQADWLRDSLVAALGGYAAPTRNTRILYCKQDTFEYPDLEGHEFVCNHLAPKLKGRPRGRRRRPPRSRSHTPSSRSSDSDGTPPGVQESPKAPKTPRRLSLRNGAPERQSEEENERQESPEEKRFLQNLRHFYKERGEAFKIIHNLKDLSLRTLYEGVTSRGGYETVCRHKLWRELHPDRPARVRSHYERFLLPYENHERRNGSKILRPNGRLDPEPKAIDTIDVTDSPLREIPHYESPKHQEKRLRTPSPKKEESKEFNIVSRPAEELNREFLDSLQREEKIKVKMAVKSEEKLVSSGVTETSNVDTERERSKTSTERSNVTKLFEENNSLIAELANKYSVNDAVVLEEMDHRRLSEGSTMFLSELAQRLHLGGESETPGLGVPARARPEHEHAPEREHAGGARAGADLSAINGHAHAHSQAPPTHQQKSGRPAGRSSLRAVRVKPTRPHAHATPSTTPIPPLRPDSASSSPPTPAGAPTPAPPTPTAGPVTNFGIHHPPPRATSASHSDDEIVEVPYKPKTPEIIDLDEYPESPQAVKKKKLEILKERGLEVTAIPTPTWGTVPPPVPLSPLINPPIMLNPAMQHQIMTQATLFQMYNIIPQNYSNGIQPPKVIQATSIFGNSGPEKTVYGNPKDPFMPPPHILHGTPVKPQRNVPATQNLEPRQDILDLTCKTTTGLSPQKPAVEIVRIPNAEAKSAQNLTKNYTLIDGKAVVGSNLEITLVNPKVQTPPKNRPAQKRSSNGKFMSTKTPTPPKDYPKPHPSPTAKKPLPPTPITIPNYQIRDDVSPTSSTGSRDSQSNLLQGNLLQSVFKNQNLAQMMEMQKSPVPMSPFIDPMYMSALYSSIAGQMDQRQLAMYRDYMANQFRGYSGLLGATPTTKN